VAKVAGVLINLDEVARAAAAEPSVSDCCAIALPDLNLGESVHVVMTARPGLQVDASRVASRVLAATALRTVPHLHVVAALPRDSRGKLPRAALEALARGAEPGTAPDPPYSIRQERPWTSRRS
jgi:acyl-CoA synthetase (AMP-forming)/AMP-acid ligase II